MADPKAQHDHPAEGSIDVRRHVDMLRRYFWFILVVVIVAVASTYGLTQRQTPIYESSARVLLRTPQTQALFPFERTAPSELYRLPSVEVLFTDSAEFRAAVQSDMARGTSVRVRATEDALIFTGRGELPEGVSAAANRWADAYVVERQAAFEESIEADIAFLEGSLSVAETERAELRSELTALEELLEETEDSDQYTRLLAQKVSIESLLAPQLAPVENEIRSFSGDISRLESIKRFFGNGTASARVTSTAGVPKNPVSPNVLRNLVLGGALGLALGIATPYLRELLRNRVMGRGEMSETADLPVLATIPYFKNANETSIEAFDFPRSVATAHYQALLTALEFASIEEPVTTVLLSSVAPGDGKTTTALNIAALASQYRNVLVIDADMRRPSLHRSLGIPNDKGLADVLAGQAEVPDVRGVIERSGGRFDVVTAGTVDRDPALLLRGDRWRRVVEDLFLYDLVIVDAPPVLAVTDAVLLGKPADGQILVTRSGVTEKDELVEAIELLQANGSRMLGIVLNQENEKKPQYSYYGKYQKPRPEPRRRTPLRQRLRRSRGERGDGSGSRRRRSAAATGA